MTEDRHDMWPSWIIIIYNMVTRLHVLDCNLNKTLRRRGAAFIASFNKRREISDSGKVKIKIRRRDYVTFIIIHSSTCTQ